MAKVTAAVIPAAGFGTRFLPITKGVSKEMLPIIDLPTIELVAQEAVDAGVKEIIIVISSHKEDIIRYFTRSPRYEYFLKKRGKERLLPVLRRGQKMAKIRFAYQKEQKGLGHAVYCARKLVGNRPFAVLLGDDVVLGRPPAIKQLIDCYNRRRTCVVGVQKVPLEVINKYGSIKFDKHEGREYEVLDFVEKPEPQDAPSDMASLGRYVLTPEIFKVLKNLRPGAGGELQLTDAIKEMIAIQGVYAYDFAGRRYDVGTQKGFVELTIDRALERDDIKDDIKRYIRQKAREIENDEHEKTI